MKRLEDIEKKDIFQVPEGYFDTLPTIIQSRVTEKTSNWNPSFVLGLKFALPVLVIGLSLFWFLGGETKTNPEQLLASVSTEDIADYIHAMEISNDDLLDALDYSQINADSLNLEESHVMVDDADLSDEIIELEKEL